MNSETNQGDTPPVQQPTMPPVVSPVAPPAAQPPLTPPVTSPGTPQAHSGTDALAIASLVVGIIAFISGWVPFWGIIAGIAAVVLGIIALKKSQSKGMSIAGIVTGGLGALFSALVSILLVVSSLSLAGIASEAARSVSDSDASSQAVVDSKKDFAKGETAQFNNISVVINSVQRNYTPEESYNAAEDGKEYILLNLTIKNTSDKSVYVSGYDFQVTNSSQTASVDYLTVDNRLESTTLAAGNSATGNLPFEITKDASNLKLQTTETVYFVTTGKSEEVVYTLAF